MQFVYDDDGFDRCTAAMRGRVSGAAAAATPVPRRQRGIRNKEHQTFFLKLLQEVSGSHRESSSYNGGLFFKSSEH